MMAKKKIIDKTARVVGLFVSALSLLYTVITKKDLLQIANELTFRGDGFPEEKKFLLKINFFLIFHRTYF